MNVQEYISSGILEQYVSGLISPQEKQAVECMSHIYPEIRAGLDSLFAAFEAMAMEMQRTPPTHLKGTIMGALAALNAAADESQPEMVETPQAATPDIQVLTDPLTSRSSGNGWLRIAASVLLIVSVALGFLLFDRNKNISALHDEIALQKENTSRQQSELAALNKQIVVMGDLRFKKINLAGIPEKSPGSSVAVYWNQMSGEVYVTQISLPETPAGKQYQLWAIADGKPVDIGMIGQQKSLAAVFQQMKNINNPQAFAITLEKQGGVASPTMSEMFVLGKI